MPALAVYLQVAFFNMEEIVETSESRKLYPYQEQAVNKIFNRLVELPPNANLLFQQVHGRFVYACIRQVSVLFPLNGSRGFAADVVHHAIDTTYIVDYFIGDIGQKFMWQRRPVGRHSVY